LLAARGIWTAGTDTQLDQGLALACRFETKFHILPVIMKYSSCFITGIEFNHQIAPERDDFLKYVSSGDAEEGSKDEQ
jgi:hypothetical protein